MSKKTSTAVEAVVGSASKKLSTVVEEMNKISQVLTGLSGKSEDLSDEIAQKEARIKALDVEYTEKLRAHDVEFGLKVKESALKTAEEILALQNLVSVPKQELENLQKGFTDLQTSFDDRVKSEIGKATGIAKSQFEAEKRLLEAQFATKEAENKASIINLNAQVATLTTQATEWKKQLESEREASVKRAQAGSVGTINVGTPNGR